MEGPGEKVRSVTERRSLDLYHRPVFENQPRGGSLMRGNHTLILKETKAVTPIFSRYVKVFVKWLSVYSLTSRGF